MVHGCAKSTTEIIKKQSDVTIISDDEEKR